MKQGPFDFGATYYIVFSIIIAVFCAYDDVVLHELCC